MTEYSQKIRVNRVQEPIVRIRVKPRVPPLEIEMQNTGTVVQWRLGTTGTWVDLIEIDDINASVTVGTVTTLPAGSPATVTNVGTPQDVILNFGIPEGGVSSVNGETGVVVIEAGDIAFTPTGGIAATTIAGALTELDSEKLSAAQADAAYQPLSFVFVEQFGAVGDGTTDDAAAIQAAIDSGAREVRFRDNRYRIASVIDMTAMNGGGCKLKGMGRGEGSVGTQIIGETSGLMIDCTGSQYVEFEDLTLKPGASNKSTIGIMFARATTAQYAQFCAMTRVHIDIPTNTAANGGRGTIGVYNYAAELFNMIDCYFRADHPYVITANNDFSLSSSFVTIETGTWSTSHIQSYGCSYVSYAFAAVRLAGTMSHIAFDHMYALRVSGTYKYAIQIEGLTDGAHFDGNLEGFERAVYGTHTMTQMSFRFRVPGTNNESLIYLDGVPGNVPGLRSSHVDIFAWNVSTQHVIEQTATGQNGTSGCEIYMHGSQTLAIGGGYSTANMIKAGLNASPSVATSGAGFFSGIIMARDWQRLLGTTYGERVLVDKPLGGVGYATGAGGTATQLTSKSTGVTLSKAAGQITTHNAALAAATIVSFVLTNTAIAAGDVLVLNHVSGGTLGAYTLNARCAAGSATIDIRNNTAGSLSEAIVIGFALIKAVTA